MPLSPKNNQSFRVADRTPIVETVPLQSGFIKSMNMFTMRNTPTTSITFDKVDRDVTLIPPTSRYDRNPSYNSGRQATAFALPLTYYAHMDRITPEDIQDVRQPGEGVVGETIDHVRLEKIQDMKANADETEEYLQLEALKGISRDSNGGVVANMFDIFGVAQKVIDFNLGDPAEDIDAKIHELVRHMSKNVKTAGGFRSINVFVDYEFFDKLIRHPKFRDVYNNFSNGAVNPLRDNLTQYLSFGATQVVSHRGVNFWTYDHQFTLKNGSTVNTFEASSGLAIPMGARDLLRGYNGPKNDLEGAMKPGRPMFITEYRDPRGRFIELELEMTKLFVNTKPLTSVKIISST